MEISYPKDFPPDFEAGLDELSRQNPCFSAKYEHIVESLRLQKFWGWAERSIERHHDTGILVGPVNGWKRSFITQVFLQLFALQIAHGETRAVRKERRHKDIRKAARNLARMLRKDPELLTVLLYQQRNRDPRFTPALRFPEMLEELATVAEKAGIEPHPYEVPNPGAKNALTNQKGRALLYLFQTYTGGKHWDWIELLVEVAEQRSPGNLRFRVEKAL